MQLDTFLEHFMSLGGISSSYIILFVALILFSSLMGVYLLKIEKFKLLKGLTFLEIVFVFSCVMAKETGAFQLETLFPSGHLIDYTILFLLSGVAIFLAKNNQAGAKKVRILQSILIISFLLISADHFLIIWFCSVALLLLMVISLSVADQKSYRILSVGLLLQGVLATSVFLFGILFFFVETNSFLVADLFMIDSRFLKLSLLLIFLAYAFLLAIFPFHHRNTVQVLEGKTTDIILMVIIPSVVFAISLDSVIGRFFSKLHGGDFEFYLSVVGTVLVFGSFYHLLVAKTLRHFESILYYIFYNELVFFVLGSVFLVTDPRMLLYRKIHLYLGALLILYLFRTAKKRVFIREYKGMEVLDWILFLLVIPMPFSPLFFTKVSILSGMVGQKLFFLPIASVLLSFAVLPKLFQTWSKKSSTWSYSELK